MVFDKNSALCWTSTSFIKKKNRTDDKSREPKQMNKRIINRTGKKSLTREIVPKCDMNENNKVADYVSRIILCSNAITQPKNQTMNWYIIGQNVTTERINSEAFFPKWSASC